MFGPEGPVKEKERRRREKNDFVCKKGAKINRKLLMKHSFLKNFAAARLSSRGTENPGLLCEFIVKRSENILWSRFMFVIVALFNVRL